MLLARLLIVAFGSPECLTPTASMATLYHLQTIPIFMVFYSSTLSHIPTAPSLPASLPQPSPLTSLTPSHSLAPLPFPPHPPPVIHIAREDLEKVCQNLSANSPGGPPVSQQPRTAPAPAPSTAAATAAAPITPAARKAAAAAAAARSPGGGEAGGAGGGVGAVAAGGGGSGVEDALMAAQLRVMTVKAAGFERQLKQVQLENEQLKEQVGWGWGGMGVGG